MWRDGIDGRTRSGDAARHLHRGWELGEKAGCDELGAEAKKLYERACGADVAVACHHLAVELSKGSAADQSRARTFSSR